MKTLLASILSLLLLGLFGCATLQNPTTKALFKIGVRTVAYEIVKSNPTSASALLGVATVLSSFEDTVTPENVETRIDEYLAGQDFDQVQRANAQDISDIIVDYYRTLYATHNLTESELLEVLQLIATAVEFGVQPSVDGPGELVLESGSLVVVVD